MSGFGVTAKKSREKQSEVQTDMPQKFNFFMQCVFEHSVFVMKADRIVSPFPKLLQNGCELEKALYTKKFGIFDSFPTVYYLPRSNKVCENGGQKMLSAIFEIDLKP
jgi:hypothetical protein